MSLEKFSLHTRFSDAEHSATCIVVRYAVIKLIQNTDENGWTLARSNRHNINAVIPPIGYASTDNNFTLVNQTDLTAADFAGARIRITLHATYYSNEGTSHSTPLMDAWRKAIVAGTENGDAFWQKACGLTIDIRRLITMRCDKQIKAASAAQKRLRAPETKREAEESLLTHAVLVNNLNSLNLLIKHRWPVNQKSSDSCTALFNAAQHGNTEAVKRLLKVGADFQSKQNRERSLTPLAIAAEFQRWSAATALLNAGANPNMRDTTSAPPLAACRTMAKSAQNPPARSIFHPFLSQYARY